MPALLISLLVSVAGAGTVAATRPGADVREPNLRVMSFNIRYGTAQDGENCWENRREMVFDVIRRQRPDVIGLQEALRFQLDEMRAALPGYEEIGVERDDGREKGEYSGILYRSDRLKLLESGNFWYSDTPEVPGSKHWGNTLPRLCSWGHFVLKEHPNRAFYHYNTHFDHISQPSRINSARLLAARIGTRPHPDPVIVTGDFNVGEDNPVITYLTGRSATSTGPGDEAPSPRLVDTFRALHRDAREVGTFNGFEGKRTGAKIDYIFMSRGVEALEAEILRDSREGRYPSDHFPIIAEVRIPAKRVR